MTMRTVLVPMFFLCTALAQDSASVVLSNKIPRCRGDRSDAEGCITPPRQTYAPDPKYPAKAIRAHQEGVVTLSVIVDSEGLPREARISRSLSPELDSAALHAVSRWKFSPATRYGKPVTVGVNVVVNFKLQRQDEVSDDLER
jgi:protein TonB